MSWCAAFLRPNRTQFDLKFMRILVVDENPDFRLVIAECLATGASDAARAVGPDAQVESVIEAKPWDPKRVPPPEFEWARIEAIVLNYEPGAATEAGNAFTWLAKMKKASGKPLSQLPPVVLLTGRDTGDLMLRATKLGVADCLPRIALQPAALYNMVRHAIDERQSRHTIEQAYRSGVVPLINPAAVGVPVQTTEMSNLPIVPGYVILRKIGEGGTAMVYLASQENAQGVSDLIVPAAPAIVLKVMDKDLSRHPRFLERFMQEFSLIQRIKSEFVTRIFDMGYDNGYAYLAMEYFGAGDLRDRIKAGIQPVQALKILGQIARALAAIHDAGVVHRDLKPHNVMFRDQHHLAIVDFGGAKSTDEDHQFTSVGHVVGTPMYMSPEQVVGKPLTGASDLYALGVILHYMLTGRPLFFADSAAQMMDMHINAQIPRLPSSLSGFQVILDKLVAKKPEDRYASAHEVYKHLSF